MFLCLEDASIRIYTSFKPNNTLKKIIQRVYVLSV